MARDRTITTAQMSELREKFGDSVSSGELYAFNLSLIHI